MTRKADRLPPQIKIGGPAVTIEEFHQFWNTPSTAPPEPVGDDVLLMPGLSFNGQPPLIGSDDPQIKIGRIQCERCKAVVGTIWSANRIKYVELQTFEDDSVVPPIMRLSRVRLMTGHELQADCPAAHGRQVIPTFEAALRGTPFANLISRGLLDPWANIIASILYGVKRYGSLAAAYRGVAYDQGGWLQPGAVNLLNKPEAVLTPNQSEAYVTHAKALEDGYAGQQPLVQMGDVYLANGGPVELFEEAAWRAKVGH